MKLNMGFVAFQRCKILNPLKFDYLKNEKQSIESTVQALKFSKYFKQNPALLEFVKVFNFTFKRIDH